MYKGENFLNEAIPLFLGVGVSPFPKEDGSRLESRFGKERADQIQKEIKNILVKLDGIKPDWSQHDLNQATDFALEQIKQIYPHLNKHALNALGWAYSYGWK
jgi:hypothetical protein